MKLNPAISGTLTRIAEGNVGRPHISADGSTVVYTRWSGDNWDIERHRDGEMEAVSKHPYHDSSPRISADGDVVVWNRLTPSTENGPQSWDVYRWEDRKESAVAKTHADEMEAQISADGETIVYTYDDTSKRTGYDIHICRNGSCEELTNDWPVDRLPQVSGDGERVLFRRRIEFDGGDLWLKDQNGDIKRLTYDPLAEMSPILSEDGKTAAWVQAEHREADDDIFIHHLESGRKEKIGEKGIHEREPALTPDGSILAYTRSDAEASTIMLRTDAETMPLTTEGRSGFPALSSDGQVIAWRAVDPENPQQSVIYKFERGS